MVINKAREACEGVVILAWVPGRALRRCLGGGVRRGDGHEEIRQGEKQPCTHPEAEHALHATWRQEPCVRRRKCAGKCVAGICCT